MRSAATYAGTSARDNNCFSPKQISAKNRLKSGLIHLFSALGEGVFF
jgi:hypothetical protein